MRLRSSTHQLIRKSLVTGLLILLVATGQLPLIEQWLVEPAYAIGGSDEAQTAANLQAKLNGPAIAPPTDVQSAEEMSTARRLGSSIDLIGAAITDRQKLKLAGFDDQQLKALGNLADQIALNPEVGKQYTAGKLPDSFVKSFGIDKLLEYDPRLIRSLVYLVSPANAKGGGQEFLDVSGILKGHRTDATSSDDESTTPEGENPKISAHARGSAADVSAVDYLRGTKFTIEQSLTGPKVKEVKHLPLQPIQVAWQADPSELRTAGGTGLAPNLGSRNPSRAGGNNLLAAILQALLNGLSRAGAHVDLSQLQSQAGNFDNLAELANELGKGYLPQALETDHCLATGQDALRVTGQCTLARSVGGQIPAFGFYGDSLDQFVSNAGREVVTQKLGLSPGALIGNTSKEVLGNAGERFWETALGDLPLGSLDGLTNGDRGDLERHVGRGKLAKLLGMEVGSIPLGATPPNFQKALGLNWADIQANSQLISNQLGIAGTNSVGTINRNPDEWLRAIGQHALGAIEAFYQGQRDAAFNLEQRPTIIDLPSGTPDEKVAALKDRYAFKTGVDGQLHDAVAGGDDQLRAWLLVNAYVKNSDPNHEQLADRLLRADSGVFYDTGIEAITKGLVADNTQRAAIRTLLKSGTYPVNAGLDMEALAKQVGFPSRTSFDAVFLDDAPAVGFAHAGRVAAATVFSTNPDQAAAQAAATTVTTGQLKTNLGRLSDALRTARSDTSLRPKIDAALSAIDRLQQALTDRFLVGQVEPLRWRPELRAINQAAQAAATSSRLGSSGIRSVLLATNGLFGSSGDAFYHAAPVTLALPGGQAADDLLDRVLHDKLGMSAAAEQIGGFAYDAALGLDPGLTSSLAVTVQRDLAAGNPAGAEQTLDGFARAQAAALGSTVSSVTSLIAGFAAPLSLSPTRLVRSIWSGWTLQTDLGSRILDAGLGLSQTAPLSQILRAQPLDGSTTNAILQSIGLGNLTSTLTGASNLAQNLAQTGGSFPALVLSAVSARTGWPIGPNGLIVQNPELFIERIIGQPLTPDIARQLGISDLSPHGLETFIKSWQFWKDPNLVPRLEGIVRSSFPELNGIVPAGLLTTLFDPKVSSQDRAKQLEGLVKGELRTQLGSLTSRLNLPGLPAGVLEGATNILLSDASMDEKSKALESLAISTGDALSTQYLGFPLSWLVDERTGTGEKLRTGLRIASQAMHLDPALSALADNVLQTFLIDGGIDTSTAAGRAQLAGLLQSVGTAAGVPSQYAALAAGFITGDFQATVLSYAWGQLNAQLQRVGIVGVGADTFYGAFFGPGGDQLKTIQQQAHDAVLNEVGAWADEQERIERIDELVAQKVAAFKQSRQQDLMYAGADYALARATGISGLGGFTKAMVTGDLATQARATGQLISAITGNPTAAAILGNAQLVVDLQNYAKSGNLADISETSYAQLDGWLGQAAGGIPIPPGTSKAVLTFVKTGDIGSINPDTLVNFGGGYIDQALHLPTGTTVALYTGVQAIQVAQAAYQNALSAQANTMQLVASGQFKLTDLQTKIALDKAQDLVDGKLTQVNLATASLVATGINLLLGKNFANLDQSLGLPSGFSSMLVNTAIYGAMVPGIAIGQLLLASVVPFAAPLLLASLGFGLPIPGFGGSQTTVKILWSRYPGLWPEQVEYGCETDANGKTVRVTDPKTGATSPKCKTGNDIVLEQTLPDGVFRGDTDEEFKQGAQAAARAKLPGLIGNLLLMRDRINDPTLELGQIRSHLKDSASGLETLLDRVWGSGSVGSYHAAVASAGFKSRRGYLYDEPGQRPYFIPILHWNF